MVIQISALAIHALLQKLAAYTKISKAEFKIECLLSGGSEEELPVYRYPVLDDRFSFNPIFYSIALIKGQLNLQQLITAEGWEKGPIFEAYNRGRDYIASPSARDRYVLSVYIKGTVWVVVKFSPLDACFEGGIITGWLDGESFIIQPVKNYLREHLALPE